jgi:hypothetical protein
MVDSHLVRRMDSLAEQWERDADRRAIFLRCYSMMTYNNLSAVDRGLFADGAWVTILVQRFADYYFDALARYEGPSSAAPAPWCAAHGATRIAEVSPLQLLLLGVNAHINFDLVFTLDEVLGPAWGTLSPVLREQRHSDFTTVNEVIRSTIDAVQDQVLEPAMPAMALVDTLLGNLDERAVSRVISNWREEVWQHAIGLLEARDPVQRAAIEQAVAERSERFARRICPSALP